MSLIFCCQCNLIQSTNWSLYLRKASYLYILYQLYVIIPIASLLIMIYIDNNLFEYIGIRYYEVFFV